MKFVILFEVVGGDVAKGKEKKLGLNALDALREQEGTQIHPSRVDPTLRERVWTKVAIKVPESQAREIEAFQEQNTIRVQVPMLGLQPWLYTVWSRETDLIHTRTNRYKLDTEGVLAAWLAAGQPTPWVNPAKAEATPEPEPEPEPEARGVPLPDDVRPGATIERTTLSGYKFVGTIVRRTEFLHTDGTRTELRYRFKNPVTGNVVLVTIPRTPSEMRGLGWKLSD